MHKAFWPSGPHRFS
ncbi:hypothetical protein CFP56_001720 [Quercus suber]|uniref:Uncharacterized protein n=1 Tax=Quercus suber TaxID=58331 RepID=A0AAW0ILQ9_QUESU